jgi:hypothetical protein
MKKLIVLLCFVIISTSYAFGSHLAAGELTYEYISGNNYKIKLRLYRDCTGATLGNTANISFNSMSLAYYSTVVLNLSNVSYSGGLCPGLQTLCTNPSSQYLGYQINEYEGVVTLTGAAADWKFLYSTCCRNNSIINISPNSMSLMATLDNLNTPLNNSVQYPNVFQLFYEVNQPYNLSFSPVDPDGDSIDIHFIPPYNTLGSLYSPPLSFSFNTPATLAQPFPTSGPIVLNNSNGNLSFQASTVGTYVIAIEANEYRNGIKIGSTVRDLQLTFYPNTGNSLPNIIGANSNNIYTVNVCPSSTLNISFSSNDPDLTDSTFLWWDTTIVGATFTTTPGLNETAVFSWSPTQLDVRPQPYIVTFVVRDDNCPVSGIRSYAYNIFVNQCNTDSVWAGDANADFTANNYDVLAIGLANGSLGPVRVGATTNWQAEWCVPWTDTFISSINYKHADCNGDGIVNASDLNAVAANYGQVHFKQGNIGQYKTAGLPDLFCDVNSVQAVRGTTVSIPIMLGTTGSTMNNFYGIAGTVELLNAQTSTPISVTNTNSWIGSATTSFAFDKNLSANKSAFSIVRNDQQNVAVGQGQIGTLEFPIAMNSVLGSKVIIQFSDLRMIDKDENEIADYNTLSDTLVIVAPTDLQDIAKNNFYIYPNPTKDYINIPLLLNSADELGMTIYHMDGKVVNRSLYNGTIVGNEFKINVSALATGNYILKFNSSKNGNFEATFSKQ